MKMQKLKKLGEYCQLSRRIYESIDVNQQGRVKERADDQVRPRRDSPYAREIEYTFARVADHKKVERSFLVDEEDVIWELPEFIKNRGDAEQFLDICAYCADIAEEDGKTKHKRELASFLGVATVEYVDHITGNG